MTLSETLVAVAVLAVVCFMLLPALMRPPHVHRARISCGNNLKEVSLAFQVWKDDNLNAYPMELPTNMGGTKEFALGPEVFRHFQAMQNEFGQSPNILICPEDKGRYAATNFINFNNSNVSYFIGITVSAGNHDPSQFWN
jgi:hypothetical protein